MFCWLERERERERDSAGNDLDFRRLCWDRRLTSFTILFKCTINSSKAFVYNMEEKKPKIK